MRGYIYYHESVEGGSPQFDGIGARVYYDRVYIIMSQWRGGQLLKHNRGYIYYHKSVEGGSPHRRDR